MTNTALEKAQAGGTKDAYLKIIAKAVERSLDIDLKAVSGEGYSGEQDSDVLLKIGELAKRVGVPNSTIRHWTKADLLETAETTASGYQMYSTDMIERVKTIKNLKSKRLTLDEIKDKLAQEGSLTPN
ncbi:MAG: helix-turn-helix domain-containing protein [Verrucomicrobiia bacterium]